MTPEERAQMICRWLDEIAGIAGINGFHGLIVGHIKVARLEALEEAAKIVESAPIGAVLSNHHVLAELCILALEIRALKDGK